ncbi:coiled-coil domain-containing protein 24-like [Oscarella lobularis]|uniref:coiled-coil domain-containing protein 24-like n=1 Tax=Oscarella lobularis TaxID=121494 RepID=UPI00331412CF
MADAFQPVPSLWSLILDHVDASEVEEIKERLGESLVDETIDLRAEVNSLQSIWTEYRKETDDLEKAANAVSLASVLPEPPAIRDRLKQEVQFFVTNLRQKAKDEGRDDKRLLANCNTRVIDYALEATKGDGSCCRIATPSSDTSSRASNLSDQIEVVQHQLNVADIDVVTDHIRSALEEECAQLKSDIHFLQTSLEEEITYRDDVKSSMQPPPSLKELRECSRMLEQEYVRGASANMPVRRMSAPPASPKEICRPTSAQKFRKMVIETREEQYS